MAKNTVADWSTTPASNTDIGGISIVGTAQVANFDNAFREGMAQLARSFDGTDSFEPVIKGGTIDGAPIGQTTPSTIVGTTGSFSSAVSFPDGSVDSPSITNIGDTNTGLYFPAADAIGATTNGVQRLQIDDNGLTVTGGASFSTQATFPDGAVGTPSISHVGDTDTGIYFPSNDVIAISTTGVQRVQIGSSGVQVTGGGSFSTQVTFPDGAAGTPSVGNIGDTDTGMFFPADNAVGISTAGTERIRVDNTGLISLYSGQLSFPATQNASAGANVLDDYEEGGWTPTLAFGGGSTGLTYGANFGTYTKVGNFVRAPFLITLTAKGTSTGAVTITLPIPASSLSYVGGMVTYYENLSTIPTMVSVRGASTTTAFLYYQAGGGATVSAATDTNFTNTSAIRGYILFESA